MNVVPFRSSFEPSFSDLPRGVGRRDERLVAALLRKRPALELSGCHEPRRRIAELDAADRVRLALDVGLRRVEHLLQRLARRRDRLAEALHARGQALRERRLACCADRRSPRRRGCRRGARACPPAALPCWARRCPSFSRQALIFACSAAVGGAIARFTSICSPPVWILATIFGTFPSWCTACRVSPAETAATPSSAAISFACACGERELRARQEEVVHEVRARPCRASRGR